MESSYLSAKVLKRTLPVLRDVSAPSALPAKRLLLPQGELAQFYNAEEPICYIACIELREGAIRGNHYHKLKEEFVYLISGEVELVVEDIATPARESIRLEAGDLVTLRAGVAHALRPLKAGLAIEFSRLRFDPADTYRRPLI